MSLALAAEKIVVLGFHKTSWEPALVDFEKAFLYAILGKLALYTPIVCKDLATIAERILIDPCLSYDQTLAELRAIATAHRARFALTGSVQAIVEDGRFERIRVTLRLFDVLEDRFSADEAHTLTAFNPAQNSLQALDLPMAAFEEIVNWALDLVLEAADPAGAAQNRARVRAHPVAQSYRALLCLIAGDELQEPTEAKIRAYEEAVSLDPRLEIAFHNLGRLYKFQGEYRQSVHNYRRALEVSTGSPQIKALYATDAGICCALMGQPEPAIRWWMKAIELSPNFINPYMNIAHTYEEQENYTEAERYFIQAQQIQPKDCRSCYSLARIYSKTGEWGKALVQYQQQLRADESDPWCHSNIATCYLQLSDFPSASHHLRQVLALSPDGEAGEYARLILGELGDETGPVSETVPS